ncbi:energy transducer TonB [Marinicella meishanensis]|uniref:energy transducer TonB n=1 Tax=Marinicella meishanensis TaxID=2873263 RepID=UPI001CC16F44|nr:energy transducer TonB [Marinicella sp. NBU2979]
MIENKKGILMIRGFFLALCGGLLLSNSVWAELATNSEAKPLETFAPDYPLEALLDGQSGRVELLLSIDEQGDVVWVEVVDAEPAGVFEGAAVAASKKYRYAPKLDFGKPIPTEAMVTIEFDPEAANKWWDPAAIERLRQRVQEIPYHQEWVVFTDTVTIESDIEPADVHAVALLFDDDLMALNVKPIIWGDEEARQQIPDFAAQLNNIIDDVRAQYQKFPGVFQRYHHIFSARNHPPQLINTIDSVNSTNTDNNKSRSFRLTINQAGRVEKWEPLTNDRRYDFPFIKDDVDQELSQLKFIPAYRDGQAVASTINMHWQVTFMEPRAVKKIAMVNNRHHSMARSWIKVAALINENGGVEQSKVIKASDDDLMPLMQNLMDILIFEEQGHLSQILQVLTYGGDGD